MVILDENSIFPIKGTIIPKKACFIDNNMCVWFVMHCCENTYCSNLVKSCVVQSTEYLDIILEWFTAHGTN